MALPGFRGRGDQVGSRVIFRKKKLACQDQVSRQICAFAARHYPTHTTASLGVEAIGGVPTISNRGRAVRVAGPRTQVVLHKGVQLQAGAPGAHLAAPFQHA